MDGNRAANNYSDRYLSVSACLPLPARAEQEQSTTVTISCILFIRSYFLILRIYYHGCLTKKVLEF